MKESKYGWRRHEDENKVDISPRGEEDRHIFGPDCECLPSVTRHFDGRVMIIHKTFDGRAGFVAVDGRERLAA